MKVFVTNVFYDEEVKENKGINKIIRRDMKAGKNVELPQEELIIRKTGTVILLAESPDMVLDLVRQKISEGIVEVEIVDEINLGGEIEEAPRAMSSSGDEVGLAGKIIFQMDI